MTVLEEPLAPARPHPLLPSGSSSAVAAIGFLFPMPVTAALNIEGST